MRMVVEHFSRPEYVEEMNQRVETGLKDWEEYIARRYFPRKGKVLNVGCGCGREAIHLSRKGYRVTAVDVAEPQLEQARKNALKAGADIHFEKTDGVNLPRGEYDVIILWTQVLGNMESKEDQLTLLESCREVMKRKGILTASGHHQPICRKSAPEYTDGQWLYPWGQGSLRYHLFTPDSFDNLFRQTGFTIFETGIPESQQALVYTVVQKM